MNGELARAAKLLQGEAYTCVVICGDVVYTDRARGVAPLLALLDGGAQTQGAVAADRVVGRAAAFLYVLLGVRELYAMLVSTPALEVLAANGIEVVYDAAVPAIKNRAGTGCCPMESATRDIGVTDADGALAAIRRTIAALRKNQ